MEIKVNMLPGPVEIHEEVTKEFNRTPISHRSKEFIYEFNKTKELLCKFVNASKVEIFTGSGTLANEVIAAQIYNLKGKGLILSLGEFSERLVKIAERQGLDFLIMRKKWGSFFSKKEIDEFLDKELKGCIWIWTVHCETSSGVINDLKMLKEICLQRNIKLCLDCISSIATVPLDLSDVYLASSTSGKAIGAYAGVSMVFYNHNVEPSDKIPLYIDLGYYRKKDGLPFTVASSTIFALKKALEIISYENKFRKIEEVSSYLRRELLSLGMNLIVPEEQSSPAVITFSLPSNISSEKFGKMMEEVGYYFSFNSYYLIEKNWIQACIMGNIDMEYVAGFKNTFRDVLRRIK